MILDVSGKFGVFLGEEGTPSYRIIAVPRPSTGTLRGVLSLLLFRCLIVRMITSRQGSTVSQLFLLKANYTTNLAGHKNFGCKELEECSIEWRRMASNPEEDQGSHRAVVPVMMMMMMTRQI
jgi:hypothetical protein